MRYASHHNFVGTPINGYVQNVCILTKAAATALSSAQKEFMSMSPAYTLKLYDCYRPTMAVHHFKSWAADVNDSLMMLEFYPDMNKSDIIPLGYILEKSGHSRGSTIDVTLVQYPPSPEEEYHPGNVLKPCYSSISERFGDNSIDMGTGFDCFDSRAHTDNTLITQQQRKNRQLLHDVLQRYGFYNYPLEWWHFSLQDEPYVDTYFNFLVSCNATMTVTTPALSDVGFV
ncbi:D-alanyl-D-alanine dipeptidase-like [Corticium candelabrum]|uniref:D-alanyl-D-alanine dipeptidase-like n=1 Tax=Corticium candelabrum TaxID=121492 RepID=UPI002E265451|nr:D-alanyl-D-alanine dipeptidase-like [Corticium candelabrum]